MEGLLKIPVMKWNIMSEQPSQQFMFILRKRGIAFLKCRRRGFKHCGGNLMSFIEAMYIKYHDPASIETLEKQIYQTFVINYPS